MTSLNQFADICSAYRRDAEECQRENGGRSKIRSRLPDELRLSFKNAEELATIDSAELTNALADRAHADGESPHSSKSPPKAVSLAAIGMLLVGGGLQLATDGRELNLLSFPLLGILIWNLAMYLFLVILTIRGSGGESIVSQLVARLSSRGAGTSSSPNADPLFLNVALPIWTTRARAWLHVGAALLAAGAIASLYLRGLGTAYFAGWESTFLDPPQVHAILTKVLGPASTITGIGLPDASTIEAMRFGSGRLDSARNWIHLFAATLGIFVIVPRILLSSMEAWKAHRHSRLIALPDEIASFYRDLLKPVPPIGERLHAITLGGGSDHSAEPLNRLLELASCPVRLADFHQLDYGFTEADFPEKLVNGKDSRTGWIAAFPLTTTPEREVHGRFFEALRENTGEERALLLLDVTAFTDRFSSLVNFRDKLEGRLKLWKTLADEHGLATLEIHFENPATNGWQEPLRAFVDRIQEHHN